MLDARREAAGCVAARRLRRMILDITLRMPDKPPMHMVEQARTSKWGQPVDIEEPDPSDVTRNEHADSMAEWMKIVSEELDSQTA